MACVWIMAFAELYLSPAVPLDGTVRQTTVICTDYSRDTEYNTVIDGYLMLDGKPYRVRLYDYSGTLSSEPMDTLSGEFRFSITTPEGRRQDDSRKGDGIFLTATVKCAENLGHTGSTPLWIRPAIWRNTLASVLESYLSDAPLGFAKALLLGDRSGIDYRTSTAFKLAGISHIIAVSGLHVSILCGLLYRLFFQRRSLIALFGIPLLIAFAALTGFSPSITRASIMQILFILGLLIDREYDGPTALSFACLCILFVNPLSVTSVSFQLSTGCMIGIFLLEDGLYVWLRAKCPWSHKSRIGRLWNRVARSISITIASMALTTPLVACYFGAVSLSSVLTNILVLWVVSSLLVGLILLCMMAWLYPPAAVVLAWGVSAGIRYVLWIAETIASFPLAAVYIGSVYIVLWLAFVYLGLLFFLADQFRSPAAFISLSAIGLCLALMLSWLEPYSRDYRVTVLDVGQGQSILLQAEGRSFLVDCGGEGDAHVADVASEKLLSQGISHIDGVILTHYDRDHFGALQNFLTRIDTDYLFVPSCPAEEGKQEALVTTLGERVISVSSVQEIRFGNTVLTVFPPFLEISGNESSLAVLFRNEDCGTLITGDLDVYGERHLLKYNADFRVNLLIAGHHGAEDSTSDALLEAAQPEYVFISVGEYNIYGHPHDRLLSRLDWHGCKVYRTDLNGTLVFKG